MRGATTMSIHEEKSGSHIVSRRRAPARPLSRPHEIKREDDESWLLPPPSSMKLEGKGHPLTVGPPFSHRQTDFRRFEAVTLSLPPSCRLGKERGGVWGGEEAEEGTEGTAQGTRDRLRQLGNVEIPVRIGVRAGHQPVAGAKQRMTREARP
jgi:hypothetical protein